jgi:hypothetical protein
VARDFVTGGGWVIAITAYAALRIIAKAGEAGMSPFHLALAVIGTMVAGCLVIAGIQTYRARQLSPVERALLQDERARTRRRPWTWRPRYFFVPWPVWLALKLPPPLLTGCLALLTVVIGLAADNPGTGTYVGVAIFGLLTACSVPRTRRHLLRSGLLS